MSAITTLPKLSRTWLRTAASFWAISGSSCAGAPAPPASLTAAGAVSAAAGADFGASAAPPFAFFAWLPFATIQCSPK
jgi:hypothetical protein